MIFIVDTMLESTLVHRIDLDNGAYLMPRRVRGTLQDQAKEIVNLVEKEKPEQIIFDKHGYGLGVAEMFPKMMVNMRAYFEMDETGRLTHKEM